MAWYIISSTGLISPHEAGRASGGEYSESSGDCHDRVRSPSGRSPPLISSPYFLPPLTLDTLHRDGLLRCLLSLYDATIPRYQGV